MREKVINLDSRKQEIMKNIPGFPISCYYSRFSQDTYDYIDWHWHVDFQFFGVPSHAEMRFRREKRYLSIPNEPIWRSHSEKKQLSFV